MSIYPELVICDSVIDQCPFSCHHRELHPYSYFCDITFCSFVMHPVTCCQKQNQTIEISDKHDN